jgi:hypothetical protein
MMAVGGLFNSLVFALLTSILPLPHGKRSQCLTQVAA